MTNAKLTILGLILEKPRHGYEIEAVIEERGLRDWTEVAFSSIYYILRKLEREALITGRLGQGSGQGPPRKIYHITDAGRAAWREATIEALSNPRKQDDPLLLGLAGMPGLATTEVIEGLGDYQARLKKRRDHVQARWRESGTALPLFLEGMFDYSLTLIEAKIAWISKFLRQLEERDES